MIPRVRDAMAFPIAAGEMHQCIRIDIDENGFGTTIANSIGCSDLGHRGDYDFVTWSNPESK